MTGMDEYLDRVEDVLRKYAAAVDRSDGVLEADFFKWSDERNAWLWIVLCYEKGEVRLTEVRACKNRNAFDFPDDFEVKTKEYWNDPLVDSLIRVIKRDVQAIPRS